MRGSSERMLKVRCVFVGTRFAQGDDNNDGELNHVSVLKELVNLTPSFSTMLVSEAIICNLLLVRTTVNAKV